VSSQQHGPAALYPRKDPVSILQKAGWGPGPVWTGGKSRPHWDCIPDRPARSSVALPTELSGPLSVEVVQAIPVENSLSYEAEGWTVSKNEEQTVLILEMKIFRKIYGAKYENGGMEKWDEM